MLMPNTNPEIEQKIEEDTQKNIDQMFTLGELSG